MNDVMLHNVSIIINDVMICNVNIINDIMLLNIIIINDVIHSYGMQLVWVCSTCADLTLLYTASLCGGISKCNSTTQHPPLSTCLGVALGHL